MVSSCGPEAIEIIRRCCPNPESNPIHNLYAQDENPNDSGIDLIRFFLHPLFQVLRVVGSDNQCRPAPCEKAKEIVASPGRLVLSSEFKGEEVVCESPTLGALPMNAIVDEVGTGAKAVAGAKSAVDPEPKVQAGGG
jgi:hypothetical protein